MKKLAMLIVAMFALSMLVASVSIANVPAPPVGQTIGLNDEVYADMELADCLACHQYFGSSPDRHHMLYGSAMPAGVCAANTGTCTDGVTECGSDTDCGVATAGVCDVDGTTACFEDSECPPDVQVAPAGTCVQYGFPPEFDYFAICSNGQGTCGVALEIANDADCNIVTPTTCGGGGTAAGTCDDKIVRDCYTDADCVVGINICSNSGDSCNVAEDCPRQYQHPTCDMTPYCNGTSAAANVPGSDDNDGVYGCLTCHEEQTVGGVTNFIVERDCTVCHVQLPNSPTVHHLDEPQTRAKAGECVACHGDIVDNMADGHVIPTYAPSLVTPGSVSTERICTETGWGPAVSCSDDADCSGVSPTSICDPNLHKKDVAEAGSCDFCHAPGTDTVSGVDVVDNHDTHHGTGVYKDRYGNTVDPLNWTDYGDVACDWCHYLGNPHNEGALDAIEIRTCENCHGMESLHSIQADSDGSGTIVVGGELAGYGHVGEDTPGAASDCWGCHGFNMASDALDGPDGTLSPTISGSTAINTIVADTAAVITITGNALEGASLELTPVAGDIITVAADSSDATSLTATVNVPVGIYAMKAVAADGDASGAVVLIAKPDTGITISSIKTACGDCEGTVTITGSGFGAEIPASVQTFMNVIQDGIELTIVSWTDTEIVATGGNCDGGAITVNGLFGSATE